MQQGSTRLCSPRSIRCADTRASGPRTGSSAEDQDPRGAQWVPPLVGRDTSNDAALRDGLEREGAGWALHEVSELGRLAGTAVAQELGRLAERNKPVLHTHDRYGHQIDEVEYIDKLGNRSNALSEIEHDGALAWLVGERGRGAHDL